MTPHYLYRQRIRKLLADIDTALLNCDPDAVHDVRVSIRRMIALNTILRNAGKAPYSKKELRTLKNKFRRAGDLRDIQVQNLLLNEWENKLQLHFGSYRKAIERREKTLQQYFIIAFKTIHLKGVIPDDSKRLNVIREIDRFLNLSYSDFHSKICSEHPLHPLRITVKKLKYALEIQQACYPGFGSTETFRKYLAHIQDLLGAWHDIEVGLQRVIYFVKRNRDKLEGAEDYEALTGLMNKEKNALLSEIEEELKKEVPLKEHVSVVLS